MSKYCKNINTILTSELFTNLINSDCIKLSELEAIQKLLIKANIDFDINFVSGTRRTYPQITIKIYISPNTYIDFKITLDTGGVIV